jgi:hypothetical protein
MPGIALSGNDTVTVNGTVLQDLADGNCVELTFPNDISNLKIGKNGNAIYGLNTTGQMSESKFRVLRGSSDDQFLLGLLNAQQLNYAGAVLLVGQFIKKIGDGQGNITSDTYNLSGGTFTKIPEAKTNVEGETEQSVSVYTIKWANTPTVRAIT